MASDETWRTRIDEDMARVPGMGFGETLAFLADYTNRTFGDQILRGELTTPQVRQHADRALARARREQREESL